MTDRNRALLNAGLYAAATGTLALISYIALPLIARGDVSARAACAPLTLVFAVACLLLYRGCGRKLRHIDPFWTAVCLMFMGLTLAARMSLLPNVTDDFGEYLTPWLTAIRQMPGTSSLAANIGNYNTPYFYALFLIGKLLPASWDMYAIKCLSVLFDYVLAYFVMRTVLLYRAERPLLGATAFFGTLMVPSVIVNSAMWGQCDSIFVAFAVGGLYFGLQRKSRLCYALFAVALSVKLQSVFLLPMLLVLLMVRRIRLRDAWVFPATFLLLLVPAMLAGRSFLDCVTIYWRQANTYSELCMLAPSMFAWLPAGSRSNIPVTAAGVFAAGTLTAAFLAYLFRRRERLDTRALIEAAFLFTLIIPFFLPLMHERYFYAADAIAAVYLFVRPKRWYISTAVCFSSFVCHIAYLFDGTPVPLWLLSLAILAAIGLLAKSLIERTEGLRAADAA